MKNPFRDKALEDLVIIQQRRIDELVVRCDAHDKQFEELRIRLSKPDPAVVEISPKGKMSNWLNQRRELEAHFAGSEPSPSVMITSAGSK